jgi:porphobilinogen synthase
VREILLDEQEGADMIMVKPAGAYLDIIAKVREHSTLPVAAYQVSGEYLMIESAAAAGWLDRKAIILESLTAIKRAGADIILTYYAKEVAHWLRGQA